MSHSSLPVALLASRPPCGTVRCAHPPGKSPSLPILTAGLATSRAMELDSYPQRLCALLCSPFSTVKMGGPFPSAAYRRAAPPQLALGRLNQRELGYYAVAWVASLHRKTDLIFFHYGWHYAYSISAAWHVSVQIEYFCNAKGQRGFKSTLAFWASRRACRPTAAFSIQLAGKHTSPASREACCRAAVKPRPTGISLYAPARQSRAEMGAGL